MGFLRRRLLVECKNEVSVDRATISKGETGQMNNACAWFSKNYKGATAKNVLIIPTKKVSSAAGFNGEVEIMRKTKLGLLVKNVRGFVLEFQNLDLKNLSDSKVQALLKTHKLMVEQILGRYSEKPILL